MEKRAEYWFPAKPPEYGWGWGLPVAWQGWVVYGLFFVLLVGGLVLLAKQPIASVLWGVGDAAALIAVCYWKGEPPGPLFGRDARRGK